MTLPLVFLPGMMCDERLFRHQINAFQNERACEVHQFGRVDNSIEAMAKRILDNTPACFALVGLSMGGIVAMEMMRQQPKRIERVALLDTNPKGEAEKVKVRRNLQIEQARTGGMIGIMRRELMPYYLSDACEKDALLELCTKMAMAQGEDVFIHQSEALRDRKDQCATLQAFEGKALVLCGREDRMCPVERHELMAGLLANATLEIIEDAGHLPTLEKPEITTNALRHWIEAP